MLEHQATLFDNNKLYLIYWKIKNYPAHLPFTTPIHAFLGMSVWCPSVFVCMHAAATSFACLRAVTALLLRKDGGERGCVPVCWNCWNFWLLTYLNCIMHKWVNGQGKVSKHYFVIKKVSKQHLTSTTTPGYRLKNMVVVISECVLKRQTLSKHR